VGDVVELNFHW